MFRTHRCVSNSGHECLFSSKRLRIYHIVRGAGRKGAIARRTQKKAGGHGDGDGSGKGKQ